ncbi:hypothetical protein pEaSNUABM38_00099 [Erwinia phage pEa_SNUABM_38]|nr:hypothetical protein pEaSNUABM38_00099 [Erwinia phage pEa_SNUABM_38]
MILESLLRITSSRFRKNGKLPPHVTIRRHGFERKYHLQTIVAIASRLAGKKRTIGISNEENAACMVRIASREIYKYRKQSPVACWALRDVEKTPLPATARVVDLREQHYNVDGLVLDRLLRVLSGDQSGDCSQQHGVATVQKLLETDIIIVNTPLESARMQDYLARRVLKPVVVTGEEIAGYYDAPVTAGEWGKPTVAYG